MIKAADLIIENVKKGTNKPQGAILVEVGYAPAVGLHPAKVTRSETFLALLHERMPKERVAEVQNALQEANTLQHEDFPHAEGLSPAKAIVVAKKAISAIAGAKYISAKCMKIPFKGNVVRCYYAMPDHANRAKGMDMYHKISSNYAPTQVESKNIHFSLADLRRQAENEGTHTPPTSS